MRQVYGIDVQFGRGKFVSSKYVGIKGEVDVAIGCVLAHICQSWWFYMAMLHENIVIYICSVVDIYQNGM